MNELLFLFISKVSILVTAYMYCTLSPVSVSLHKALSVLSLINYESHH